MMRCAKRKTVAMISLAALIGGCSPISPLFDRSGYRINKIKSYGSSATELLATALATRTVYQEKADALEDSNWWADAPLFGAAVGLVSAIYFGGSLDTIAGITIGAGTIATGRTLLKPTSRATGYYAGAKAMRCVYAKGQPFKSAAGESAANSASGGNLSDLIRTLGGGSVIRRGQTVKVTGAVETLRKLHTVRLPANAAAHDSARKAYEAAFAVGRNALTTARNQLGAANAAESTLTAVLMEVEDKVKTLVRLEPLDFGQAVTAISGSLTAAATQRADILKLRKDLAGVPAVSSIANVASPQAADQTEIDGLKQATTVITDLANAVSNYSIDYLQAKTDVAACAALLGAS